VGPGPILPRGPARVKARGPARPGAEVRPRRSRRRPAARQHL